MPTPGVTVIVTSPLGTGTFQTPFNIASRFIAWDSITAIGCQVNPDQITALNNFGFTVKVGALTLQSNNTGVQAPSAFAQSSGKYYYEIDITAYSGGSAGIVIAPPNIPYSQLALQNSNFSQTIGCPKGVMLNLGTGSIYSLGTTTLGFLGLTGPPPNFAGPVNDIIGVAVDLDLGRVWFKTVAGYDKGFDPDWNGGATGGIGSGSNPSTGVLGIPLPAGSLIPYVVFGGEVFSGGAPGPPAITTFVANFGIVPFVETVPTNFEIWPAHQIIQ